MNDKTLKLFAAHGDVWCMDLAAAARFIADLERGAAEPKRPMPRAKGTVAIVPVSGVLTKRGGWGMESTDRIIRTVKAAIANSSISGIVLDVDSPGGSSYGLKEFSDQLFELRSAKPLAAVANPVAASAALWAGTSVTHFSVTPSGEVGSHGVWSLHLDWSKALEAAGVKPTFIFAGAHKVDGNPYEPLTEEAKADIQAMVDDTYEQFSDALARNRGIKKPKVKAEFGEGRMLLPAQALKVGMVDKVATLEDVLREMKATDAKDARDLPDQQQRISEFLCDVWAEKQQAAAPEPVRHIEAAKARRERERARAAG